jgi:pyridoxamine 5'-phosphate oxidase
MKPPLTSFKLSVNEAPSQSDIVGKACWLEGRSYDTSHKIQTEVVMTTSNTSTIDPFQLFSDWFHQAEKNESSYPNAMSLATLGEDGFPDVRIVLMKDFDSKGVVFYTNYLGKKGRDLAHLPKASLCFHWKSLEKQVRFTGTIEKVSADESDQYFGSRARLSQLGAWASEQSQIMPGPLELEKRMAEYTLKFHVKTIPRPEHWGGYRLKPIKIEFWEEALGRLHRRRQFQKSDTGWAMDYLFP